MMPTAVKMTQMKIRNTDDFLFRLLEPVGMLLRLVKIFPLSPAFCCLRRGIAMPSVGNTGLKFEEVLYTSVANF